MQSPWVLVTKKKARDAVLHVALGVPYAKELKQGDCREGHSVPGSKQVRHPLVHPLLIRLRGTRHGRFTDKKGTTWVGAHSMKDGSSSAKYGRIASGISEPHERDAIR